MRTSVEIALQDSASAQAQKIATGFDSVAQSADGINSALDPKVLEDYNRQLTQIGENYSQLKNKEKSYSQQQLNVARQVQGIAAGTGRGISQLGAGDPGGAAMTAGQGLGGLASLLGGPAAMIGGLALAGGMGAYKLATQYEQRAVPAGRVAALSGQYGTDIRSNTMALRDAMESTTDAVAKYGKTFEEGARAQETYLMAGGRDFGTSRAAAYSQALGLDFNRAAAFEGLTGRYGQTGGLDWANKIRKEQGLSPAMLGEVMGGMQDIFTQGLSGGVIRTTGDIGRQMEFFGRAGQTWQGALGAQKLQGMGQTLAGAANLQGQSDMFLYRAASKIAGGDLLETRKLMEGGMNAKIFGGLMEEFDRFGYGKTESILQLSKIFGLSTTEAERMYGLRGEEAISEFAAAGQLPENMGKTTESKFIENKENQRQFWAGKQGAKAFDVMAGLLEAGTGIFGEGGGVDTMRVQNLVIEGRTRGMAGDISMEEIRSGLTTTRRGVSIKSPLLKQIESTGLSEEAILGSIGARFGEFTKGSSQGGEAITSSEMSILADLITKQIESTDKVREAVLEDITMEDNRTVTGMTQ